MTTRKPLVAVIGASSPKRDDLKNAREVGRLVAKEGWVLINGGLDGVMEASAEGASKGGGIVVGILPTASPKAANPYVTIPIATNMHWARNAIIAQAADAFIAIGGSYGTLSEIALALAHKKKVFGLGSWKIEGVVPVGTPEEAIQRVKTEIAPSFRTE